MNIPHEGRHMVDTIAARAYHFSIVVVGPMNPRLHHPLWYRLIGAISEEEEATTLAGPSVVVIPPLSRFEVGGITIACQENRWEIVATQPAHRERIKDIASLVFKKLFETPIQIYGFNNNFELETSSKGIPRFLADVVLSLDLGMKAEGEAASRITFIDRQKSRKIQILFGPSDLSAEVLSFAYNSEYNTKDELGPKPEYFDLGDLMVKHFEPDYQVAVNLAARLVAWVNQRCGGK